LQQYLSADTYRSEVADLYGALRDDSEAKRMEAVDIIRSLVKEIILTPEKGELQIDVRGDLAGILAISLKTKIPATRAGLSQVEVVAGARFDLTTFRLRGFGFCLSGGPSLLLINDRQL
jgi:site-specific DNA recombinase